MPKSDLVEALLTEIPSKSGINPGFFANIVLNAGYVEPEVPPDGTLEVAVSFRVVAATFVPPSSLLVAFSSHLPR
jgi:hypothetical protein